MICGRLFAMMDRSIPSAWVYRALLGFLGFARAEPPGIAGRGLFVRFLAFRDEAALQ